MQFKFLRVYLNLNLIAATSLGVIILPTLVFSQEVQLPKEYEVLSQISSTEELLEQAEKLYQIGRQQYLDGQFYTALDTYQKLLVTVQEIGESVDVSMVLHTIGLIHYELHQNNLALSFLNQALQIYQESNNQLNIGRIINTLGAIYESQGKYSKALELYQQALLIRQEVGDREGSGKTLNNIGNIHLAWGDYDQALIFYQEALAVHHQQDNHSDEAASLKYIGIVYHRLGNYAQTINFYKQALTVAQASSNPSVEAHILNSLGFVYTQLGQYSQAQELYQQALTIRRQLNDRVGIAQTLNNIGFNYGKQQKNTQAFAFYQEALVIFQHVEEKRKIALTLNNLGFVSQKLGKYEQAKAFLLRALSIAKTLGDPQIVGMIFDSLGKVEQSDQNYSLALESYQKSLVVAQQIGNRNGQRITLSNLGDLFAQQQQPELAIIFYKQSVNVTESIRQDIRSLSLEQQTSYTNTIADTYRRLADLLLQQNRVLEAQQVLELLKIQELDDYLGNVRGDNQSLYSLPQEQEIQDSLSAIINREISLGKELTQLEQIPVANRTATQQERILELRNIQQQIRQKFNQFIRSETVTNLIAQLSYNIRRQSLDLESLNSFRDDLQRLEQNAVLLTPLILEDRLELIITTPYSPPIHRSVAVTKTQLNQAILDFRLALKDPNSDAKTSAQKLYNWLIKPIESDLAQAETKTIIYSPDGQLRYLPLAALYDGEQWLIERFGINNITAASLTELDTPPSTETRVMAGAATGRYNISLGNYRYSFASLPFAKREVENLTLTIPQTTQLLDGEFNRNQLIPYLNDHTIIHLATHAMFVTGQPEDSFILLGDGNTISLREIDSLSLTNVDLVVLSACDTGIGGKLGNGEEILGFGYQMQKTGARAAMASLWKVNDGGTQVLMNTFYKLLYVEQMSKTEALQQAQKHLIKYATEFSPKEVQLLNNDLAPEVSAQLNHPYYWAPFILIGNGL